jgi:hypothetical protein
VTSTRRRAVLGAIGATVLLFAATACASESDDSADSSPAAETIGADTRAPSTDAPSDTAAPVEATTAPDTGGGDPEPTDPAVVVPEALQFTAPLVGGGTFDGAEAAGKPTMFWFWAPT